MGRRIVVKPVDAEATIARLERDVATYDMLIKELTPQRKDVKNLGSSKELRQLINERAKILKEILGLKKIIPRGNNTKRKIRDYKPSVESVSTEDLLKGVLESGDDDE